jgi:hypothetical protein
MATTTTFVPTLDVVDEDKYASDTDDTMAAPAPPRLYTQSTHVYDYDDADDDELELTRNPPTDQSESEAESVGIDINEALVLSGPARPSVQFTHDPNRPGALKVVTATATAAPPPSPHSRPKYRGDGLFGVSNNGFQIYRGFRDIYHWKEMNPTRKKKCCALCTILCLLVVLMILAGMYYVLKM